MNTQENGKKRADRNLLQETWREMKLRIVGSVSLFYILYFSPCLIFGGLLGVFSVKLLLFLGMIAFFLIFNMFCSILSAFRRNSKLYKEIMTKKEQNDVSSLYELVESATRTISTTTKEYYFIYPKLILAVAAFGDLSSIKVVPILKEISQKDQKPYFLFGLLPRTLDKTLDAIALKQGYENREQLLREAETQEDPF